MEVSGRDSRAGSLGHVSEMLGITSCGVNQGKTGYEVLVISRPFKHQVTSLRIFSENVQNILGFLRREVQVRY